MGPVAFLAFNKKIADEINRRTAHLTHVRAGTFHSFGLKAWKKLYPKIEVDGEKMDKIIETMNIPWELTSFVKELVGLAKQAGVHAVPDAPDFQEIADYYDLWTKVPERLKTEALDATKQAFAASSAEREWIDFNDMIWFPLHDGVLIPEFDWVLVDEAQDTNAVRRAFARGILKPEGRLVAVGDPHQAIYGFTGADAAAMDRVEREFKCDRMPLTVTYRCPKAVVAHARQWVNHIEAAPEAPEGSITTITSAQFEKLWPLPKDAAVLCRLNRPLVSLALAMIRKGFSARVEGRDIGAGLVRLATRWRSVQYGEQLKEQLRSYLINETEKLRLKHKYAQIASLEDRVASLNAIIDSVGEDAGIPAIRQRIESLFVDTEAGKPVQCVTLSSVHKAKGREWNQVFLFGRDEFMPSQWAQADWEREQEINLIYVAVTRAKRELVEVETVGPDEPEF